MAINPVPLANLLQKAGVQGSKKIRIMHSNKRLVAVPLPSNVTLVRPQGKFIMPRNLQPMTLSRPTFIQIPAPRPVPAQPAQNVIDLDSDDEPVVLEKNQPEKTNSNEVATVCDKMNEMNVVVAEPVFTTFY